MLQKRMLYLLLVFATDDVSPVLLTVGITVPVAAGCILVMLPADDVVVVPVAAGCFLVFCV